MPEYKVQRFVCRLVKDGQQQVVTRFSVPSYDEAQAVFEPVFRDLAHEEVWIALCNAKNDVRGLVRVSQGGVHGAALRPCDVLRPVIASGCGAFVMAHNHPSGDPTPSEADIEMTRALVAACEVVGLTLLDHLVYAAPERWRSLRGHSALDWR